MPEETPDPDVKEAAADPSSITVDGTSVTNRSIKETIEADRHINANSAKSNGFFGIGMRRVNPGSAVRE